MKLYRWFPLPKSWRYLQCSVLAVILAFFGLCTLAPTLPSWCGFGRCGFFPGKAFWQLEANAEYAKDSSDDVKEQKNHQNAAYNLKQGIPEVFEEFNNKFHLRWLERLN